MKYCLENALELAGYITARVDLDLNSLHWILFHAQAIHLVLKGKRLFGEGVLIRDSGVVIPSVERNALVQSGFARVRYKGTLSEEHKNILAMSMLYSETPSVVTLCTVGVVENYLRKTG
jgi:hypothetical protein